MENNKALVIPDEETLKADLTAINKFQKVVPTNLIEGQDFGVIPGTGKKPTLLKPGAEKITKILGLCDLYEILDRQEDWDKPFFRFLVKCKLVPVCNPDIVVSEGLGECNSMESKYRYRWLFPNELPSGFIKNEAVKRTLKSGSVQYRVDNDDIHTQVNTLLKMARKRALVDAALSAGRLSNVFTQDIEDMAEDIKREVKQETKDEPKIDIDMDWLRESLEELQWADVGKYLRETYKVSGTSVKDMILKLNKKQATEFIAEVQKRKTAKLVEKPEEEVIAESQEMPEELIEKESKESEEPVHETELL